MFFLPLSICTLYSQKMKKVKIPRILMLFLKNEMGRLVGILTWGTNGSWVYAATNFLISFFVKIIMLQSRSLFGWLRAFEIPPTLTLGSTKLKKCADNFY